jgi:hypothetical protein
MDGQRRRQQGGSIVVDKRKVIIIGAGVSASSGIPVAKDLLKNALLHEGNNKHRSKEINRALQYLYPDFDERFKSFPNIEDFLNLLEMARVFNSEDYVESSLWPKERVTRAQEIVLSVISEYIWSFSTRPEGPAQSLRDYLSHQVSHNDVIVTFNWDLLIEQAIEGLKRPPKVEYQYSRDSDQKKLVLLKPHGSVNWFDKESNATLESLNGTDLDSKIKLVNFSDLLLSRDTFAAIPLLVAPLANKDFSSHSVLSETWTSVYKAVSDATSLYILGYSLPKEDQFSRFVLRRALRQNILRINKKEKGGLRVTVVNPDENAEGTFARLVDREKIEFRFHRAYFDDYVRAL